MTRPPRPPKRCTDCGAPILWWRKQSREGWLCVDTSSDDRGRIRKVVTTDRYGETRIYGQILTGDALLDALADGVLLFTLHSTTCSGRRPRNPRPAHIPRLETSHGYRPAPRRRRGFLA